MPTLIKNGKNYSGTSVSLTQAEYDALSTTQKNDGTVYFISDSDAILDASDVAVGNGTVEDSIGSIAVIETSPATSSHAVGTYLVWNGKLYKVTSAIAVSEQLVVGTNISAVTVGSELTTLNNGLADVSNLFIRSSANIGSADQTFDLSKIQETNYPIFLFTAGFASTYLTAMIYMNDFSDSTITYVVIATSNNRSISSVTYNTTSKILTITLNQTIYRKGMLLRLQ